MLRTIRLLAASTAFAALPAQEPLHVWIGKSPNAQYGSSVAAAGDVDADGYPDVVVGAAIDNRVTIKSGAMEVRSGRSRELLYTWVGAGPGDELGFAGAGVGDVDADGHDDVAVACIGGVGPEASFIGHARVYSGRTGERLFVFRGARHYDFYGISVSGAGDVNGDGHADIAVGCPGDDDPQTNHGYVEVRSGADGAVLHRFDGTGAHDQYGWFHRRVLDVDGDGVDEILIGAPGHLLTDEHGAPIHPGYAELRSGRTGALLHRIHGTSAGDRLGWNVAAGGDFDGDGHADLVLGAPFADADGAVDAGAVQVHSSRTGELLARWTGTEAGSAFGWAVDAAGDVNDDGTPDVWIAAPYADANGTDSGAVWLVSGADGARLAELAGRSPEDQFGYSVADLGEVEAGLREVVVGARADDHATGQMVGTANVYRLRVGPDPAGLLIAGGAAVERVDTSRSMPSEPPEVIDPPRDRLPWVLGLASLATVAALAWIALQRRP